MLDSRRSRRRARAAGTRVVDEQSLEALGLDVRVLAEHLANDAHALVGTEERLLLLVDEYRDDDALEEAGTPQDDVHVTVGQRIERARKDREAASRRARHVSPLVERVA